MSRVRPATAAFVLVAGTILVLLGEVPRVIEEEKLSWAGPVDGLVHSGAIGGALVLAALGHLACAAFLRAREHGRRAVVVRLATIALPLLVLQSAVLVAATVIRWLDAPDADAPITSDVWFSVATFRWNFWVAGHMLEVPPEVVGLALFSIAVQLVALLAVVVVLVPERWIVRVLAALASMSALAVMFLRWRAVDFQDPYLLSLDTFARSDAFLVGVATCCLVRLGRRSGPSWTSAAALVVIGAVFASGFVSTEQFLALQLPLVALLAGVILLDDDSESGDWILQHLIRSSEVDLLAATWSALVALAPLASSAIGRRGEMNWILRVTVLLIVLAIVVRVARAVALRLRLPERTISLSGLADTWRRVVAEADHDVRTSVRGRHEPGRQRYPDDDGEDPPPG